MILDRLKESTWGAICAQLPRFAAYTCRRFQDDRCLRVAASLSYTSLLALVPMAAIGFAMLAAFPVFEGMRHDIEMAVFQNLLPDTAIHAKEYFDKFVANANRLTAVGIVGLAVTAVMLLGTIEAAFNLIFRVTRPRGAVPRLMVFWAVITLGPISVGASFSLGTYLFAVSRGVIGEALQGAVPKFALVMPTLTMILAFTLFYVIIPNRPVRWRYALVGGTVAGLLFSGLRYGFSIYVAAFPTYQTIYGAVSALPIFLVWMYLSWTVVIFGAVITAGLAEWRRGAPSTVQTVRLGGQLALAIQILSFLFSRSRVGRHATRAEITQDAAINEELLAPLLSRLDAAGYVAATSRGDWVLSRDLERTSLADLMRDLDIVVDPEDILIGVGRWRNKLAIQLVEGSKLARPALAVPLRELIDEETDVKTIPKMDGAESGGPDHFAASHAHPRQMPR